MILKLKVIRSKITENRLESSYTADDELIKSDCEEENFSRGADGGILLPMTSRVYGSEHKTHSQGNFKL